MFAKQIGVFRRTAVMRHPKRRPCQIERTEKPTAHLAHLVLPDTKADPSQNQKS